MPAGVGRPDKNSSLAGHSLRTLFQLDLVLPSCSHHPVADDHLDNSGLHDVHAGSRITFIEDDTTCRKRDVDARAAGKHSHQSRMLPLPKRLLALARDYYLVLSCKPDL